MMKICPPVKKVGKDWDYKGQGDIVQIFLDHDNIINYIQFQYVDEKGVLVLSNGHGRLNGIKFTAVKFNYPSEYLICVSGTNCIIYGTLTSITFVTNLGTYGPFGNPSENDSKFNYHLGQEGQFGGFHGTADELCVRSFGIYFKPINSLDPPKKVKDEPDVRSEYFIV